MENRRRHPRTWLRSPAHRSAAARHPGSQSSPTPSSRRRSSPLNSLRRLRQPAEIPPSPSPAPALGRKEVREVQTRLRALGFNPGPVDGDAGRMTATAVTAYQEKRGLPQTGELDRALLDQLRQDPEPKAAPAPQVAQHAARNDAETRRARRRRHRSARRNRAPAGRSTSCVPPTPISLAGSSRWAIERRGVLPSSAVLASAGICRRHRHDDPRTDPGRAAGPDRFHRLRHGRAAGVRRSVLTVRGTGTPMPTRGGARSWSTASGSRRSTCMPIAACPRRWR